MINHFIAQTDSSNRYFWKAIPALQYGYVRGCACFQQTHVTELRARGMAVNKTDKLPWSSCPSDKGQSLS